MEHFKKLMKGFLQIKEFDPYHPKAVEDLSLRKPRFKLPPALEGICFSATAYSMRIEGDSLKESFSFMMASKGERFLKGISLH